MGRAMQGKKGFSLGCNTARVSKKPARRGTGRAVGSWACVVGLFGFGEVGLDVFRLDVVEIAGAGIDGEADEAADEDVAPDPAGDGMGEGKGIYDVQFTIYNLKSSRVRRGEFRVCTHAACGAVPQSMQTASRW